MAELLGLCHELQHEILKEVDPQDLAALSGSCKTFNGYIKNNRLLWKDVYLQNFDPPPRRPDAAEPSWEVELQRVVALRKLLLSENSEAKRAGFGPAARTMVDLLQSSSTRSWSSRNVSFLSALFRSEGNVDTFLCGSSLFRHGGVESRKPAATKEERQLSAKLHVLHGMPHNPTERWGSSTMFPYARSRVYDLRRYTDHTLWGPFMDDGSQRVDWERVEAIMIVLTCNLRLFSERTNGLFRPMWTEPFAGVAPNSFTSPPSPLPPLVKEPAAPLDAQDPYGITGTWMRVVCFLDYSDLYAFNFNSPHVPLDQDRDPVYTEEATRLITLKLRVIKVEPPGEDDGQALPVVTFTGTSRSVHASWDPNANSKIRGMVRLTPEGEIRWTTWSIFHGEERWRSEGIQVGGIRSARGVFGNWFDKDYDVHGPAGPTAFWKVTDEIVGTMADRSHLSTIFDF